MSTFSEAVQLLIKADKTTLPDEIASKLEDGVNTLSFKPEEIIESLSDEEKEKFQEFSLYMVRFFSESDSVRSDGRNEISINLYKDIDRSEYFQDFYNENADAGILGEPHKREEFMYMIDFWRRLMIRINTHMHRTNQQTLAGAVVYSVGKTSEYLNEYLCDKYGDRYYRFPLI